MRYTMLYTCVLACLLLWTPQAFALTQEDLAAYKNFTEYTKHSPKVLAEIFLPMSDYTDLQRGDALQGMKGKVVTWTLPIYEVAKRGKKYIVDIQGKKASYPSLELTFVDPSAREKELLHALKTGDTFTFRGMFTGETGLFRVLEIEPVIVVFEDTPTEPADVVSLTPETKPAQEMAPTPSSQETQAPSTNVVKDYFTKHGAQ